MEAEQISIAANWLESPDPLQRVVGAEQLAAYPTPKSERLLSQALRTDPDPEVRSTAARNLLRFKHPSDDTIEGLFAALSDRSADTRLGALVTLESFVSHEAPGTRRHKMFVSRMKSKERDARIDKATREAIKEFVDDHL